MRLAFANKFVSVLLLAAALPLYGQTGAGRRVFRLPYDGPGDLPASNVFISLPFVRIGEPWNTFKGRKPRGEEESALQTIFAAIYSGDTSAASVRVNPPKDAASASAFTSYIGAFKASLERMGDFDVEGYFPLPGEIRFALRPLTAHTPYRLITLRPGPGGFLRFDETHAANKIDSVLNSAFRRLKDNPLEVPDLPRDGFVVITAEQNPPYGDVQLAIKVHMANVDLEQIDSASSPVLKFYKSCLSVPQLTAIDLLLRCYSPEVETGLRSELAKMSTEKQEQFLSAVTASRHIDYVVENPTSVVLFYHFTFQAASGRDWIEQKPEGNPVLLNPLVSFPLDDLLFSSSIRTSIMTSLGSRNDSPGVQSK